MYKQLFLFLVVASRCFGKESPVCENPDTCHWRETLPFQPTQPGELQLVQFANDSHDVVDPYTFRVALDPHITDSLREFCTEMELLKIFENLMGPEMYYPGDSEEVRIKGKQWFIQRPEAKWNSNAHWLNAMDETAHDHFLRVLGDGGFQSVLDAVGTKFDLDSLTVYSVGLFVVNQCQNGYMHYDFENVDGKAFNILIPVNLPQDEPTSQILVASRNDPNVTAAIDYQYDVAVGVGDGTNHAAGDCDYSESGEVRLMASLYIADVTDNNVENLIQHYTDPFPPADTEFLLNWKGLHWNKQGSVELPRDWRSHTRTDTSILPGPTESGKLELLRFSDGTIVDPYAFRVAFPETLTQALQTFCQEMGFAKLFDELMTPEGEYEPGTGEIHQINGMKWQINRPAKKWNSNSHWLNPMSEEAQDQFLRVLGDGGFDVVLEAIGKHFHLEGLTCYSVGLFVVNHSDNGWMHDDFKKVDGKAFNILFPVQLPKESIAELKVESVDYSQDVVHARYERNVACGVGDSTRHATGDCDYRDTGEMRVMVTIYLADITDSNVNNIINHYTDDWPPADEDYLLTRSGIHWTSDGLTKLPRGPPRTEREQSLLPGPTKPGEVLPLQFQDGVAVDPFAFRVRLPENLTKIMRDYCDKIRLTELFEELMDDEQLDPGEDEYAQLNGNKWYVQRPSAKFHTTAHWLSTSSEEAHEEYLQVLAEGGFDIVLEGIGKYFGLDDLVCYSVGFVVLDQCDEGYMHYDFKKVSGNAFSLLFPIILPVHEANEAKEQHFVRTRNDPNVVAKVDYEYGMALGVGDYTRHTTGDIDHRESDDMIVLATIYVAHISEENVEALLNDFLDPFPPRDVEYFLNLKGPHWNKEGSAQLQRKEIV